MAEVVANNLELELEAISSDDSSPEVVAALKDISKGDAVLLRDETWSDFEIVVVNDGKETKKKKVHKMILSRNEVFRAMLISNLNERNESTMTIYDFSYEVVYELIRFIYTGTVKKSNLPPIVLDVIRIADKYSATMLIDKCKRFIWRRVEVKPPYALTLLNDLIGKLFPFKDFQTEIETFIVANISAIRNSDEWEQFKNTNMKKALELMERHLDRNDGPPSKRPKV